LKKLLFIFILTATLAFSQQEASVWYFGQNAGLKFETSGAVTPLSNGQINTEEGSSSIADANGNLLFYTDGRTVWDRNHLAMPNGSFVNGTELLGDTSSTQSGIIIPKPGDPNIYYIFTVDEPHHENAAVYPNAFSGSYVEAGSGQTPTDDDGRNNGLNYSVVDLSVIGSNGSIGNIISRNNPLITYDTNPAGEEIKYKCSEKISAIKNEVDGSYWVITHFTNKFYAFRITASGVVTSPVITTIGSNQTLLGYRRNAIGYLKIAPNGQKLAMAHQQNGVNVGQATLLTGSVELFDFDTATGVVSNSLVVEPNVQPYGVEFSPNSEKLFATYRVGTTSNMFLTQYNLTAANIPNSKVVIYNQYLYLFALQLAPNNKIYCATGYISSLGVINNPDVNGLACNYVQGGQPLISSTRVKLGLPPFITSFFNASFTAENFCLGSTTQFTLNTSQIITSASWDFGDGSPLSTDFNPMHLYATIGDYIVSVTATGANGTITKSKTITISSIPLLTNSIANQTICGMNTTIYDLSQHNSTLLGGQSSATFGVAYFTSMNNLLNHIGLLPLNYNLTIGINTIYAKVYNLVNNKCYVTATYSVTLFRNPVATAPTANFVCDDSSNDGVAIFNLSTYTSTVLGTQNSSQYTVSYHFSQSDADAKTNSLALNYQNVSNPQTIYVRVENILNTNCYTTTSFQIGLYKKPIANHPDNLYACDSGNDGAEVFDLALQSPFVLGTQSLTDFAITYHSSQADANSGANSISTNYTNTINPQTIYVRVENKISTACFTTTTFELQINAEPILVLDDSYTICEGYPITLSAPTGFSTYAWSNSTGTYNTTINTAGNYSLTVTADYGIIICSTTKGFTVYNSNVATISRIETSDWTDNQNMIAVTVSGDGDYEYSLDGIQYQVSNIFSGLNSGQYTIYVNDKKGCGTATQDVFLLMYPKFFTPNGDGINDVWRVKFANEEPNMKLYIYDRYGKLIQIFNGLDFGWDGMFNGKLLFSDDYWFVVKRQNGKEFRGHFSLLR